mmetsp:Transcript_722/g.2367  ORF Transcript_722/g.2367 Transcript_722/m.2367 type:complete len:198 (-) Transcript_722:1235-1828(-)
MAAAVAGSGAGGPGACKVRALSASGAAPGARAPGGPPTVTAGMGTPGDVATCVEGVDTASVSASEQPCREVIGAEPRGEREPVGTATETVPSRLAVGSALSAMSETAVVVLVEPSEMHCEISESVNFTGEPFSLGPPHWVSPPYVAAPLPVAPQPLPGLSLSFPPREQPALLLRLPPTCSEREPNCCSRLRAEAEVE